MPYNRSSPRERGSSAFNVFLSDAAVVVPARAGVIRVVGGCVVGGHRRPRASGGHPSALPMLVNMLRSSPRERGSSEQLEELRAGHAVVPARAGVIRTGTTGRPRKPGRPRASGGHPREDATIVCLEWSSPRERGSSAAPGDPRRRAGVVPARAGVIRRDRTGRGRHDRRPRASGGHPSVRAYPRRVVPSSPRERGSSAFDRGRGQRAGVVPARAGVIRTRHGGWATPTSRPRASGGHPRSTSRSGAASMSSPRERGSSADVRRVDHRSSVVPARAGVIRSGSTT